MENSMISFTNFNLKVKKSPKLRQKRHFKALCFYCIVQFVCLSIYKYMSSPPKGGPKQLKPAKSSIVVVTIITTTYVMVNKSHEMALTIQKIRVGNPCY